MLNPNKSNDKSELEILMAKIRSGNLVEFIESTQFQFEEKFSYLTQKLKKSEEENTRKLLILEQNSQLIEKFQKQIQELSDQNSELLNQQQELKEENVNSNVQLQRSEDKFAGLDILYDQEITQLSENNNELQNQFAQLKRTHEQFIDQFDKTQKDFNEKLSKAEQHDVDLKNKMNLLELQKNQDAAEFKRKMSEIEDTLNQKIIDYEEKIKDLEVRLASALDGQKEVNELKHQIEKTNNDRRGDLKAFDIEKSKAVADNNELKSTIEDLKKKLDTKQKEVEDIYVRFKQISRVNNTPPPSVGPLISIHHSGSFSKRKHASPDDPTPFDDESSDTDVSSVSIYKSKKLRLFSTDHDETSESNRKNQSPINHIRVPSFGYKKKKKVISILDDMEVPESPIVSSSAFANNDKKL